uniref:Uncharacterized protein n=1 Tax=Leptospira santarosai serovar Arenal str. MAVJ 401 TaxID=1049976 RepID=M6K044_9LEPT|nr:hypothetical protein LEP1GSC063_1254 [Leptospira santarosai serovar Arenal str. MAVJ 401]
MIRLTDVWNYSKWKQILKYPTNQFQIRICILRKHKVFLILFLTFFSSKFNSYSITKSTSFLFG